MAIPKIIHYCWLSGDPYPELVQRCIQSWKKYLPDYKIMLWDQNSFDIHSVPWVEQACAVKKWPPASDFIRLYALYNYGGIYLDSDVEVIKNFDSLLHLPYFICRESKNDVPEAAVIGAQSKLEWVKQSMHFFGNSEFAPEKLYNDNFLAPLVLKNTIKEMGLSEKKIDSIPEFYENDKDFYVFSSDFFSPLNNLNLNLETTKSTFAIHWFTGTWESPYQKRYKEIKKRFEKMGGPILGKIVATLFILKEKIIRKYER